MGLKRFLRRWLCIGNESMETEKRQRERALKAFFARRGVQWPRQKKNNREIQKVNHLGVLMKDLYPDLSVFQNQKKVNYLGVVMKDLYPDLSGF